MEPLKHLMLSSMRSEEGWDHHGGLTMGLAEQEFPHDTWLSCVGLPILKCSGLEEQKQLQTGGQGTV